MTEDKFCRCLSGWSRPKEFIADSVWHEPYDENKTYGKEVYERDYGDGTRRYVDVHVETEEGEFVCAYEAITARELAAVAPYCPCYVCLLPRMVLERYTTCACCLDCLKAVNTERVVAHGKSDVFQEDGFLLGVDQAHLRKARARKAAGIVPIEPLPVNLLLYALICLVGGCLLIKAICV